MLHNNIQVFYLQKNMKKKLIIELKNSRIKQSSLNFQILYIHTYIVFTERNKVSRND